jgi:superfamily II DNA or RNA helicase
MNSPSPLKITISSHLRLTGFSDELSAHLKEKLTFLNPKWLENQRMGRWNRGTKQVLHFYRAYGKKSLRIPRGYTRQLIRYCQTHQIDYRLDDRRRKFKPIEFVFSGQLKPFQDAAVSRMLARDFGTLTAPTGSGKTVMALYMIAQRRQPVVIVVHTKDLARQWIDRIGEFLSIPESEVGMIGGGRNTIGKKVTVALVQSLYKRASEVARQTGYLIVDECHRCPSRTFTVAVSAFDSKYMTGLSATPFRRDRLSKLIFWHLGDVHHEVDQKLLEKSGDVLRVEVIVRETAFEPYYDPIREYSKMLSELTANDDRNRLIAADVAAEAAQYPDAGCLILSDRKKHCETIQALLRFKFDTPAALLTGDVTSEKRNTIVTDLDAGRIRVVAATGQLVGEGFDCKALSTLFLATPVRFSGRIIQYLGRVLRPAPGKTHARVFDYVDVHVGPLVTAAHARQRVYCR